MKIGYPCINRSIGCTPNRTFRLASWSPARFEATVAANLGCLEKMVEWNIAHGLLFLRIGSGLIPFASHPVCTVDWQARFAGPLRRIGARIRRAGMRICMHPDQCTLLNSPHPQVTARSIAELAYHCAVLDAMHLPLSAKVQLHVGGLYGEREAAAARFTAICRALPPQVRRRLVIENDERLWPLADCLELSGKTGVPVLLDFFHHSCLNRGETPREALAAAARTWRARDGVPMTDYSTQDPRKRPGAHAPHIDTRDFARLLRETAGVDFDIMLEIKDKERSALAARRVVGAREG